MNANKYRRLATNTLLVFAGNAGAKFIGLIMLPFYTRWLSVEDYGLTDVLGVYQTFLLCIVSCSIADSLFIYPKGQNKQNKTEYISSGLSFVFCMFFIFFIFLLLAQICTDRLVVHNSFVDNYWYIYGLVVSSILQNTTQQVSRSLDKIIVYSTTGVLLTLSTAFTSFVLIPEFGVKGFVIATIVSNIISAIYSFIFAHIYEFVELKSIKKGNIKEMLKYSIPLIPNGIMWWILSAINRPIMESNLGLYAIGIYAVANKFPNILTTLCNAIGPSWQISVLEEYGSNNFNAFYDKIFSYVSLTLVLLYGIVCMLSERIVSVFADNNFHDAWHYIPILTLASLFSNVSGIGSNIFSAVKQSKYYFYSSLWGGVSGVLFNILLIPVVGLYGACISVALSFGIMCYMRFFYSWKFAQLINLRKHITTFVFCFIMLFLSYIGEEYLRILSIILTLIILILANRKIFIKDENR